MKSKKHWVEMIEEGINAYNEAWKDEVSNTPDIRERIYEWARTRINSYVGADVEVASDITAEYFFGSLPLSVAEKEANEHGRLLWYHNMPIILYQDADWEQRGAPPVVFLVGSGRDRRGYSYKVTWDISDVWVEAETDYQRASKLYERVIHDELDDEEKQELEILSTKWGWGINREPTIPDILDDMSNAADWDDYTVHDSDDDVSDFISELKKSRT